MRENTEKLPLQYYIDQLAEHIVLQSTVNMCELCSRNSCNSKQNELTCRYGVKSFLIGKADAFAETLDTDMRHNRDYYDFLNKRSRGEPLDKIRDTLMNNFSELPQYRADAIVLTWHALREAI